MARSFPEKGQQQRLRVPGEPVLHPSHCVDLRELLNLSRLISGSLGFCPSGNGNTSRVIMKIKSPYARERLPAVRVQ